MWPVNDFLAVSLVVWIGNITIAFCNQSRNVIDASAIFRAVSRDAPVEVSSCRLSVELAFLTLCTG